MYGIQSEMRGTSFRPAEAKSVLALLKVGDKVRLEPEPENAYDPNAIKCVVSDGTSDHHVAYVAKEDAANIVPVLSEAGETPQSIVAFISGQVERRNGKTEPALYIVVYEEGEEPEDAFKAFMAQFDEEPDEEDFDDSDFEDDDFSDEDLD